MKKPLLVSTFLYFSILSLQELISEEAVETVVVPEFSESDEIIESGTVEQVLSLKMIDKIIKQKDYNTALAELAVYMKANPKDFDRAQKRVAKIMKSRWKYNSSAQKLADAMKDDSTNINNYDSTDANDYTEKDKKSDQEKLNLIVKLETREQNQSTAAEELTRQARKALALRFYISRYNKIMEDGYRLLKDEKYEEALAKFQEGFRLKPNDSDKIYSEAHPDGLPVTYSKDITIPVDDSLKAITAIIPEIERCRINCQKAYEAFIAAVKARDYQGTLYANNIVQTAFKKYADVRNRIQQEVEKMQHVDELANKRNPDLKGFSYITFTLGFITGDEDIKETGVLGTMDLFWNTRIEGMKNSLYELTYSDLLKVKEALPENNIRKLAELIDNQKKNTENSVIFPEFADDIQSLNRLIITDDGSRLFENYKEYENSMAFIKRFAVSLNNALEGSKLLSDTGLKKYAEDIDDGRFIASRDFLENNIKAAVRYEEIMNQSLMESYIAEELTKEKDYFRRKDIINNPDAYSPFEYSDALEHYKKPEKTTGIQIEDAVLDYRDIIEYQQKIAQMNFDESQGNTHSLWGGLAVLFATNADAVIEDYEIFHERSSTLLNGVEERVDENDAESAVLRKYPAEAREISDKVVREVGERFEDFTRWREALRTGEKYSDELPNYVEGIKELDEAIKILGDMVEKGKEIYSQSTAQVKLAEMATQEAEANYNNSIKALEKKDFESARNYLNKASQKYAESFNIQESKTERAKSDRLISALSERIVREENELVIAEVREMINDAQDSYYDGNLDYAEKRLIMAQNRWSVTNAEKNEEIETLLELVSTARTLQIGRKIKTTDPLYSDMSQLLSVANQFYEEGKALMQKGNKEEAVSVLNLAKEKLEPMKLIYPLNDDAAFLRLKIEKELDPEAFNAGFKRRVDDASSMKPAEKLAALENLLKINPTYPGLAKQVENLQYELGVKTRPTAAAAKNGVSAEEENRRRAQSLYSQANSIFNAAGNNQSQLQRASALLDEIIRIYTRDRRNSLFRQATALKDRIQSRIGGTVVAVLTADDEANFQRAQNQVNRGNYDAANDILEKLWKNPAAQKTKKIIDLRTFVKNRL